jgi:hypothetical protein
MEETSTGNAVAYEIINKETGEVIPVNHLGSGDQNADGTQDFIVHMPDGTEVTFLNPDFQNGAFMIRQAVNKRSPDDSKLVYFSEAEAKQIEEAQANSAAFEEDAKATEAAPEGEATAVASEEEASA